MEAFSDGMFAIILTILVFELKVPHLENNSLDTFLSAMYGMFPKLGSFVFTFFIIAIFWVNHHHLVYQVEKVDSKLLWLNITLLFSASLFPFLCAFIGDYPGNPYGVALFPLNMALSSITLGTLWKHAFVDTELAPNILTKEQKRKRIRQDRLATVANLIAAGLAFIWVPITLIIMTVMPFLFVVPELLANKLQD